ncbi:MAG: hypothetical protein WA766_06315, partial [Candidatus Acidiferrales bacterium]
MHVARHRQLSQCDGCRFTNSLVFSYLSVTEDTGRTRIYAGIEANSLTLRFFLNETEGHLSGEKSGWDKRSEIDATRANQG